MREPSLHITRRTLIDLMDKFNKESDLSIPTVRLVDFLMKKGVIYRIHSRGILESNQKIKRKLSAYKISNDDLCYLILKRLNLLRSHIPHKVRTKPEPGDKSWPHLSRLAQYTRQFAEEFNFKDLTKAIDEYLTIGISLMNTRTLRWNWWNDERNDNICDTYGARQMISDDPHKELTTQLYEYYQFKVYERGDTVFDYTTSYKYKYFVLAAELCIKSGLTHKDFIDAQFDSFRGHIPAPVQLITDNAKERLVRWVAEHGKKKEQELIGGITREEWDDLAKHINNGDNT